MDDNGQWVSVADGARRLGVTRQAIQGRIKRGTIEHRHDNRGNPIVRMPARDQQPISGAIVDNAAAMPIAEDVAPKTLKALTGEPKAITLSAYQEMLEALQAAHRDAMERQERLHREAMTAIVGQVDCWRERADRAEVVAEQVNAMLHDLVSRIMALPVTEPERARERWWWWRLFGSGAKSNMGPE